MSLVANDDARRRAIPGVLAILVTAALIATCLVARSAPPPASSNAFDAAEFTPYDTAGTAEIVGTGVATPALGMRSSIASRPVTLRPVTNWSRHWWAEWALAGRTVHAADPRAAKYVRETPADSTGVFRFDRLPAGQYYVLSSIMWVSHEADQRDATVSRVMMGKQVTLAAGQHVVISLDSLRTDAMRTGLWTETHGPGDILRPTVPDSLANAWDW